jgi:hypothetical protein
MRTLLIFSVFFILAGEWNEFLFYLMNMFLSDPMELNEIFLLWSKKNLKKILILNFYQFNFSLILVAVRSNPFLYDDDDNDTSNSSLTDPLSDVVTKAAPKLPDPDGFFDSLWSKVKNFVDDILGLATEPDKKKPASNSTSSSVAPSGTESTDTTEEESEDVDEEPKGSVKPIKSTTVEPDEEEEEPKIKSTTSDPEEEDDEDDEE